METFEAREQLAMVDRILARASEPDCVSATPFLIWGIAGAIMNVVAQLVVEQHGPLSLLTVAGAALAAAVVLTVLWSVRMRRTDRLTLIDRQVFNAFNVAWVVAVIAQLGAFRIFDQWAQAAIWLVMYGAAMIFVGSLVRSRAVFIGGAILIASLVVANFVPHFIGYVFAAGDLIGMAGAGLVIYSTRR